SCPRAPAFAPGRKAFVASARQPSRSQLLVLGRYPGNERRGPTHPSRAVLYRRRRDTNSRRLAQRRCHAPRAAQRSSALRNHVVFPGGCIDRDLCPLPPSQCRNAMTAYQQLEERFHRIGALEQAVSVLHWDTAAMMPEGGAVARAEQLATLRSVAHQ